MMAMVFWMGMSPNADAATVSVGQPAPDLVAADLDGGKFDLRALKGKVVIVNFWATWCAPCREEMPTLSAFYRQNHSKGIEMIGLSLDRARDRKAVRKIADTVSYPIALSFEASTNGFGTPGSVPTTYVIDGKGTIRAVFRDAVVTEEELSTAVFR